MFEGLEIYKVHKQFCLVDFVFMPSWDLFQDTCKPCILDYLCLQNLLLKVEELNGIWRIQLGESCYDNQDIGSCDFDGPAMITTTEPKRQMC
ncbi:uncharacterized protein [Cicer arietinum]|uniref:uncharacterized protein isoform X2 n=1 Tax=Cicer arietinum TaxID=3827 RepID=UPI003CC58ED9